MKKYIISKLLSSLVLLVLITMVVFALVQLQPGNPYLDRLGPEMSPEQFEKMLQQVGYYDPIWLKYFKWLKEVLQGNLGISIKHGQSVSQLIKKYMAHSIVLISISYCISSILGVFIGVKAGKSRSYFKKITEYTSVGLMSLPSFFISIVLIKLFAYDLKWLPSSGMYNLSLSASATHIDKIIDKSLHMIMPISVLVLMNLPALIQFSMTNMEKELSADYIRTAEAKGISDFMITWKHIFRNIAIPLVALLSIQAPSIFSGAMITETIFNYPGMGKLGFDAVLARDYPLIMGILLINTVAIIVINFCADFIYVWIDPRIRLNREQIR